MRLSPSTFHRVMALVAVFGLAASATVHAMTYRDAAAWEESAAMPWLYAGVLVVWLPAVLKLGTFGGRAEGYMRLLEHMPAWGILLMLIGGPFVLIVALVSMKEGNPERGESAMTAFFYGVAAFTLALDIPKR